MGAILGFFLDSFPSANSILDVEIFLDHCFIMEIYKKLVFFCKDASPKYAALEPPVEHKPKKPTTRGIHIYLESEFAVAMGLVVFTRYPTDFSIPR